MQKLLLFFFIALCVLFTISVSTIASSRITNDQKKLLINEQLQLAHGLAIRGYYDQAISEYKDIIKRFPNNELVQEAWGQLAYVHSEAGEKESALNTYKAFFKKYPKSSIYTAVRVNYAKFLGSFDVDKKTKTAIKILSEIINSETVSERLKETASFFLAEIYDKTNEKETAKSIYNMLGAKTLNKKNIYRVYALLKIAHLYIGENQPSKAIEIYNKLIENNKLKKEIALEAFQSLAMLYTKRKMFEQAADVYGKLSIRFSKTKYGKEAMYHRLECLYQAKKYNTIIKEIDSSLNSSSSLNTEQLFFIKACALQQQFYYATAYTFFLKVLDKKVKSDFYWQAAVQSIICLLKTEKSTEAKVSAFKFSDDKFLSQNAKETILNIIAEKTTKNSDLISFWEKAIISTRDNKLKVWIEYKLALCYEKGGNFSKALSCYNNILKQSKDKKYYPYALNGIASCNIALENHKEADKYLDQIISEHIRSEVFPGAVLTKAEVYIRNNEYDEAFNILSKYKNRLLKSPAWPKAVYYFGCLSYAQKDWSKAKASFKEILSNGNLSSQDLEKSKLYLGLIYIEENNLEKAEKLLTSLIIPEFSNISKLDQKRKAEVKNSSFHNKDSFAYKQQSVLDYCNHETVLRLGYFFIKVKKYEIAEFCFNKLISTQKSINFTKLHVEPQEKSLQQKISETNQLAYDKDNNVLQKAYLGLAKTYSAQNNIQSTIDYYKRAAFVNPLSYDTSIILAKLGKVLLKDNRNEEAVLIFQKILSNHTDTNSAIEARMGMARILAKQPDRILRANRYAMSVFILSKNPQLCIDAMLLSIKLSVKVGNFKEAKNTWKELGIRFPKTLKTKKALKVKELIDQ